jgi:hypothetical protein
VATRRTTIGILAGTVLIAGGCGGTSKYVNRPRAPIPVNATVFISPSRVSVSPSSVGAGPVVFLVTNQAATAQPLVISPAGSGAGGPLASTAPINPGGTAQVSVDLASGDYTVSTGTATAASTHTIRPARMTVGRARPGAGTELLQP